MGEHILQLCELVEMINSDTRPDFINDCLDTAIFIEDLLDKKYGVKTMGTSLVNGKIAHLWFMKGTDCIDSRIFKSGK
jgi:hypothetical protein